MFIQLLRFFFFFGYMIRASAFKSLLELVVVVCQIYVQGAKLHVFHLFFGSLNIQNTLLCLQRFWKVCFLRVMIQTKFAMMKRWVLYKHIVNKLNSWKIRRKKLIISWWFNDTSTDVYKKKQYTLIWNYNKWNVYGKEIKSENQTLK